MLGIRVLDELCYPVWHSPLVPLLDPMVWDISIISITWKFTEDLAEILGYRGYESVHLG